MELAYDRANDLHEAGLIDHTTMREYESLFLPPAGEPEVNEEEISPKR